VLYPGLEVPRAIPDNNAQGVNSRIYVPASGAAITSLTVRVDELRHTFNGDLRLTLLAPDGTSVLLADRDGYQSHDFYRTVFYDGAAVSVQDGSGPFTGQYRPRESLSGLHGKPGGGTWTLHVADLTAADNGTLHAWTLELCANSPLLPPPVTTQLAPGAGGQLTLGYAITASIHFPSAGIQQPMTATLGVAGHRGLPPGVGVLGNFFFVNVTTAGGSVDSFDPPVTITFHPSASAGSYVDPSTLRLYFWRPESSSYGELPLSVNPQNGTMTASLWQLTEFGIVGDMQPALYLPLLTR
jgi:subtilisin-like proprotein convertase family protein